MESQNFSRRAFYYKSFIRR